LLNILLCVGGFFHSGYVAANEDQSNNGEKKEKPHPPQPRENLCVYRRFFAEAIVAETFGFSQYLW